MPARREQGARVALVETVQGVDPLVGQIGESGHTWWAMRTRQRGVAGCGGADVPAAAGCGVAPAIAAFFAASASSISL